MTEPGRHFIQIPGPTNVPDRILRAMARPTIDHRGETFAKLSKTVLAGLKGIFKTKGDVIVYPGSGSGAWEAALVNTLSPGDSVLMFETGHFAVLWERIAAKFGLETVLLPGDWRGGADPAAIEAHLRGRNGSKIKAVCIVHNETSTGAVTAVANIRKAIDAVGHDALLMVDTISSLASIDFRMDEWGVDVTVGGSQKGLMLPPGLAFNAISKKALETAKTAALPRSYWSWEAMLGLNPTGFFPYTPATNMLYGLAEAIDMLNEEGLDRVFARHDRHAAATRGAVAAWELELQCADPTAYSSTLTAVRVPDGHSADGLRKIIVEDFSMSLGNGLSKIADKVFRIGHLGDFNDLMLTAALSGVEMGLERSQIPHQRGGVQAAMDYLAGRDKGI